MSKRLRLLTEETSPTVDDLLYLVDPAGSPGDRKVTLGNLADAVAARLAARTEFSSTYEPLQLIAEATPTSGFQVTFSSIPATFKSLEVHGLVVSDAAGAVRMRFNNDFGSNYDAQHIRAIAGAVVGIEHLAQTQIVVGSCSPTPSAFHVSIPGYALGAVERSAVGSWAQKSGTTTGLLRYLGHGSFWRSTAAINRVDVLIDAYFKNFQAGTTIQLYGRK